MQRLNRGLVMIGILGAIALPLPLSTTPLNAQQFCDTDGDYEFNGRL